MSASKVDYNSEGNQEDDLDRLVRAHGGPQHDSRGLRLVLEELT